MNDRNNKTSICSIVFLDIIGYSKKTDSEQIEIKTQFNALINHSLKDVAENDRIILDTGDGAAIASSGSPEDILFIALNIRDEILKNNIHSATPLYVRFGVNLGPVRVVKDINDHPNIIGDGINVAQRIMSFAKPNQILVSRSYYEVTSRLTQEISQMFDYSGLKQDKHVREHEVYSVRLLKEQADSVQPEQTFEMLDDAEAVKKPATSKPMNWKYAALATPALVTFFLMIKPSAEPATQKISLDPTSAVTQTVGTQNAVAEVATTKLASAELVKPEPAKPIAIANSSELLLPNESIATLPAASTLPAKEAVKADLVAMNKTPEELLEIERAKKKAKLKAKKKAEEDALKNAAEAKAQHGSVHQEAIVAAKTEAKKEQSDKSGFETFKESIKQGGENKCSQAQIAMNQCN